MLHPKVAGAVKRVTQMLPGATGAEDEGKKVKLEDWVTWRSR